MISGAAAGDKINLSAFAIGTGLGGSIKTADLTLGGANLAAANNKVVFTYGTYDSAAGTFAFAANGADTVVTYDTDATGTVAGESIILVGFHAAATTSATLGLITLA